jgi:hypothetical protein
MKLPRFTQSIAPSAFRILPREETTINKPRIVGECIRSDAQALRPSNFHDVGYGLLLITCSITTTEATTILSLTATVSRRFHEKSQATKHQPPPIDRIKRSMIVHEYKPSQPKE